jgi:hypothetical protein
VILFEVVLVVIGLLEVDAFVDEYCEMDVE